MRHWSRICVFLIALIVLFPLLLAAGSPEDEKYRPLTPKDKLTVGRMSVAWTFLSTVSRHREN